MYQVTYECEEEKSNKVKNYIILFLWDFYSILVMANINLNEQFQISSPWMKLSK